jgi:1-acyl-sn-glycerol-3-phosphate acyltransferase
MRSFFARNLLRLFGWKTVGWPDSPKRCIVLAHPHTSNWDFIVFLLARWSIGLRCHWVGKHTLFKPPFGWFFKLLDGVPVNRSGGRDSVTAIAEVIQEREIIALGIAPSGSRSLNTHWRSGFYYIGQKANVPLVLGFIDYEKKITGISDYAIEITGDLKADMDRIREFYAGMKGRHPHKQNPILLKAEEELAQSSM